MDDLDHLSVEISPLLEAAGGVLDKFDYNRLRRLGVILRNIPHIRKDQDWDLPPASLQGWIKSYAATVETVQIAGESGLLSIISEKSDEIRGLLSPAMVPSLDTYIFDQTNIVHGKERVEEMISFAKGYDKFQNFDFASFLSKAASNEEIARVIVVMLGESIRFCDRPRVGEDVGAKRLQIGALIGKAAAGGALAVSNLSIGALAALTGLPTLGGSVVGTALAVVGSTFTGLATACDAVDKIAAAVRQ